ncbi:hypothetical protein Cflav_PD0539 [Pedosphaera parvula Ellin514]|uniref:Uncharacterized protein n=1 Tax=Pedosphaera parvula (strain Ellin514) TaxID=320771 RepID=B9XRL1_PEDPL|nr:hypothetical protein Cflav_PD0539 [Pedosphaera parvula Ellin514]
MNRATVKPHGRTRLKSVSPFNGEGICGNEMCKPVRLTKRNRQATVVIAPFIPNVKINFQNGGKEAE